MVDDDKLSQLRARLISLRGQRNRMVHRVTDLERRTAQEAESAGRERVEARAAAERGLAEIAAARSEVQSYERTAGPGAQTADWQRRMRAAVDRLRQAEEDQVELEGRAANAELAHARLVGEVEVRIAEETRSMRRLDAEIERLRGEIAEAEADRPLPDAPDPEFRGALVARLEQLDEERAWLQEELSEREERLRRVMTEATHLRALLKMHTYAWSAEAPSLTLVDAATERTAPAWRAAVVDTLRHAGEPMHYRDIAAALARLGQGLGGQDPAETLLAALSRDADFSRVARGVYWLAGQPLPTQWQGRRVVGGGRVVRADRRAEVRE